MGLVVVAFVIVSLSRRPCKQQCANRLAPTGGPRAGCDHAQPLQSEIQNVSERVGPLDGMDSGALSLAVKPQRALV